MLILLSDGAGLTARQCATVLARAGHRVEALSPAGLCLCRMTRHVRRVHDVPALGRDPSAWLEAALDVAARRGADVLLPVQEQVAVMAMARDRIEAAGLATAVPGFAALAQVQDKVSAFRTLARVGVPQPPAVVAATAAEVEAAGTRLAGWPLFVKMPIGTASAGVRRAGSPGELRQVAAD
jgi:biotin carboxylase